MAAMGAAKSTPKAMSMTLGRSESMPFMGFASAQGPREYQEDRASVIGGFHLGHWALLMVLDGHGGPDVADFVKSNYPLFLSEKLRSLWPDEPETDPHAVDHSPYEPSPHAIGDAMKAACITLDYTMEMALGKKTGSGACAVMAIVTEAFVIVAWLGDCRAYLMKRDGAPETGHWTYERLTSDHEPRRKSERARIEAAGHFVVNGRLTWNPLMGDLNISRAFGDYDYKVKLGPEENPVSCVAEIAIRPIEPDMALVLCSDGVLKVHGVEVPNDGLVTSVVGQAIYGREVYDPTLISQAVIVEAAVADAQDNMTVAVWASPRLGPVRPKATHEFAMETTVKCNALAADSVAHVLESCV